VFSSFPETTPSPGATVLIHGSHTSCGVGGGAPPRHAARCRPPGGETPPRCAGRSSIWGVTDNLNQKFRGQERDTETGLDVFQARYHGSGQGRSLSADPVGIFVADRTNPQS